MEQERIQTRVQILIPTFNAADLIDDTMQSIWNQTFDRENIYIVIVDFGSTDGTYEKVMAYDPFHMGVYQANRDVTKSQMVSETARLAEYTYPGGEYCYQMLLMPGDVIYPDYLTIMTQLMYQYRGYNLSMIISEVDVREKYGTVTRKKKLYNQPKVIDGKCEYLDYISRGYQQNIMCFGGWIEIGKYRIIGSINERAWWNKSLSNNYERNVLYIPERLGCYREKYYENELEEILLRWESVIVFIRTVECKHKIKINEDVIIGAQDNLGHYALWRSYLLMNKGERKGARDCFCIAGVISPAIKKTDLYQCMERLVMEEHMDYMEKIKEFFEKDDGA